MTIKLVVGECTLNVVSAYAPQVGLDEEIKRQFWEGLDDIVRSIPPSERLFIGGDFNGHIGSSAGGYTEVHDGFGFGERNGGGTSLLDFAKAFYLMIANSSFPKWEEHLVNYQSSAAKTQIDYLLLCRCDRRWCEDCKVILGETLATQHRLLVMDIGITIKRKMRFCLGDLFSFFETLCSPCQMRSQMDLCLRQCHICRKLCLTLQGNCIQFCSPFFASILMQD
uniref:Craniofacial development protein 2-like n=1 Tax=Nicotiana tabacum TaxID=4097 RepID=A0A1S3X1S8_TOBAC|nr:PREDICTED: craniofacial development protein 2-like [Nicotiana tabacum]